jgi:GDPmannose 4,6-dehydratase
MPEFTHKPNNRTGNHDNERSALIIGITGQDGSYLTEHLLAHGYTVHGLVRRASMFNRFRLDQMRAKQEYPAERLVLHYGDLNDLSSMRRILRQIKPREVYHLAGQSHVGLSFEIPEVTCQENGMATLGLLEALRDLDYPVRFYHAASPEIFGVPKTATQTEETPINPVNTYGCAKAFSLQLCRVYRSAYGLFACSGIAYNHESPRRGENFVTRKITQGAARVCAGDQAVLSFGNLDARRDWGYAPEYVVAMWKMLQADSPNDYVLASGRACSVREFAFAAFAELGFDLEFESKGVAEFARRKDTGEVVINVDSRYFRPLESIELIGDSSLAKKMLGWAPKTIGIDVARLMAKADGELLEQNR